MSEALFLIPTAVRVGLAVSLIDFTAGATW